MGCDGKERFLTFGLADRVAGLSRNRHAGYKLHPYRCRDCGAWHVGSTVGPKATRNGYVKLVDNAA